MINFFRKTRKKLADNNQFLKYSRYAIGEIALVMIGILLALQVNNWNEYRKDRITEVHILKELLEGLSMDVNTLNYNISKHNQAAKSCTIILDILSEKIVYNDSLSSHFAAVHFYTTFSATRGAFESLKSRGFERISNPELRSSVIYLYENWYNVIVTNEKILRDDILELKRNFNPEYFDKFHIFNSTPPIYSGKMIPNDIAKLRKNSSYTYHIWSLHSSHIIFNSMNELAIHRIEKLKIICQKEIERLS